MKQANRTNTSLACLLRTHSRRTSRLQTSASLASSNRPEPEIMSHENIVYSTRRQRTEFCGGLQSGWRRRAGRRGRGLGSRRRGASWCSATPDDATDLAAGTTSRNTLEPGHRGVPPPPLPSSPPSPPVPAVAAVRPRRGKGPAARALDGLAPGPSRRIGFTAPPPPRNQLRECRRSQPPPAAAAPWRRVFGTRRSEASGSK